MIRRPPRPTLLPNATLFRSASDELAAALGHAINAMAEPMVSHDVVAFDLLSERVSQSIRVVQSGQGADEDRKSTHLNSSHANISYAVFCLKKKRKTAM